MKTLDNNQKIEHNYKKWNIDNDNITDKDIINLFWLGYNGKISPNIISYNWNYATDEILNYIDNRFKDSESRLETVWRIKYGCYEERPKCPICGKSLPFGRGGNKGIFNKTCSTKCGATLGYHYTLSNEEKNELKLKATERNILRKQKCDEEGIPYRDVEKFKQTMIDRYGTTATYNVPEFKEKIENTCLERYGKKSYLGSNNCKEKTIEKLGVDTFWKTKKSKELTSKLMKGNKDIQIKREQTMLKRYGVTNPWHTQQYYDTHDMKEIYWKGHLTRLKNGSYKQSKQEDYTHNLLIKQFPDIIRQYTSSKYPFQSDFYIPSKDLYIECNYHWTHGGHPYDKENDIEQLELWKSKNSQFYKNAINTWTVRDVNKREIAKKNNLNYLEFFSINEFETWIDSLS